MFNFEVFKFSDKQIDNIINKVVPIVASKEDHDFFKRILYFKAESCISSSEFSYFITQLLEIHKQNNITN